MPTDPDNSVRNAATRDAAVSFIADSIDSVKRNTEQDFRLIAARSRKVSEFVQKKHIDHVLSNSAAFAFLSKSIVEVQKNAQLDMKLIASRTKAVAGFLQNLTDVKVAGPLRKDNSLNEMFETMRKQGDAVAKNYNLDELDFFRNLKAGGLESSLSRSPFNPDIWKKDNPWPLFRLSELDSSVSLEKFQRLIDTWDPLKKVSEGIREFENAVAVSRKSQGEAIQSFVDNLVPTKWSPDMALKQSKFDDVPPLDLPELLESLVRQSEPFLENIGVSREVYSKIYNAIQKGKTSSPRGTINISGQQDEPASSEDQLRDSERKLALEARIASVFKSTGYKHESMSAPRERFVPNGEGKRNIAIFTTASLPWMTGTAVNPLLRAAYLAKAGKQNVTLLVPWLSKGDQEKVYPNQITFESPVEQEEYVKTWLRNRIGFLPDFKIKFYPGLFSVEKRSILAVGDISTFVPDREADVAVLEEPEHLTWYYHGRRWTEKFRNVVGIVHTNYLEYVRREKNGAVQAYLLEHVNNWMVRCYCHKVVRLSAATQNLPRSMVCNVHGVGVKFLEIGKRMAEERAASGKSPFKKGAYYLGKMVWSKGYRELLDLLHSHRDQLPSLRVDVFGSGEDSAAVESEAVQMGLRMRFHKGRDHADLSLQDYKVFINPSMSDVVCTTTAEALAMGKIVVCADHPSNEFFLGFPNCLTYTTPQEFVARVSEAMEMEPAPLTEEHRHLLSWEAATDRFLECAGLRSGAYSSAAASTDPLTEIRSPSDLRNSRSLLKTLSLSMSVPDFEDVFDKGLFAAHFCLSGIEGARLASGAPPKSKTVDPRMCRELGLEPPPPPMQTRFGW